VSHLTQCVSDTGFAPSDMCQPGQKKKKLRKHIPQRHGNLNYFPSALPFLELKCSLRMEFTNWKQAADFVAAVGYGPPNLSVQIESQTSPVL